MKNKELKILLSAPRGFCAGVERAIEIVEKSIQKYGSPVYVRHEIVHNKFVVDDLRNKGAIFVEELEEIEDKTRPVIFSAHGVAQRVINKAKDYLHFQINNWLKPDGSFTPIWTAILSNLKDKVEVLEIEFLKNENTFDEKDWEELYKISEETFVKENESLKNTAAGAGLTDND